MQIKFLNESKFCFKIDSPGSMCWSVNVNKTATASSQSRDFIFNGSATIDWTNSEIGAFLLQRKKESLHWFLLVTHLVSGNSAVKYFSLLFQWLALRWLLTCVTCELSVNQQVTTFHGIKLKFEIIFANLIVCLRSDAGQRGKRSYASDLICIRPDYRLHLYTCQR
jgi:hypothetical protein